jgi:hypothetical protein
VAAQRACGSSEYLQREIGNNPNLPIQIDNVEKFIKSRLVNSQRDGIAARELQSVITIPVVVHILYHYRAEDVSDQQVASQLDMMNKCFRRLNADTANTPAVFRSRAADCGIEFRLAISDPQRRSTTGIIRKYTPITTWTNDDKVKYSAQMGDDAWDPQSYFNIWVCNLRNLAGYSSVPGGSPEKDGIVIDFADFGPTSAAGYELGRTAVHETGHWLGLKHIWGDAYCGDDFVDDTPPQSTFTQGCPTGARTSCSNASLGGDMYMNYMDYTNDECINLFTEGQKTRMRALFDAGGTRFGILSSNGLNPPLVEESPLPDDPPRWLHPQLYPNPATSELVLDVSSDTRWLGKSLVIYNTNGQLVLQSTVSAKIQAINIAALKPGIYILSMSKEDGSYIKQKFVKM